ncbi:hypothetical protein OCU04_010731 [Sclerotinia nivalis]|uniref:Uncharacterized protein n=1 Tax=Sclerotinia nivalis TaxID=352851 RepID=A0A9X0ACS2_9HELO|nr:hypothetical protein OCU04_010731 [Sclerotinia nivalis]
MSPSSTFSTTSWTSNGTTRNASSASIPAVNPKPQWPSGISIVTFVFVSTFNSTSQTPSLITSIFSGIAANFGQFKSSHQFSSLKASATPTTNPGKIDIDTSATSTVVDKISVKVGKSIAVASGVSYMTGQGAPQVVTVMNTHTITIGVAGVEFAQTTLTSLAVELTNYIIIGGRLISVGSSSAHTGSSNFTYGLG